MPSQFGQSHFAPDTSDFALPVTNVLTKRVLVAAAGSKVPADSNPVFTRGCFIKAEKKNTGLVYVGGKDVNDVNGMELGPGEGVSLGVNDLSMVYVYSPDPMQAVRIMYGT